MLGIQWRAPQSSQPHYIVLLVREVQKKQLNQQIHNTLLNGLKKNKVRKGDQEC